MILLINYSHKWWYKALSVLLVIALILAISFGAAPKAHAVGVLTLTVCAAILAVMAGAGIATVCAGMTSSDIQSWMKGKLEEWDLYRNDGNIFSDLIQNNLITTTVKGTLAIGNAAARGISDFITWLKGDIDIDNNDSISVFEKSPSFGEIPVYYASQISLAPGWGSTSYYATYNNNPVVVGWVQQYNINNTYPYSLVAISTTQFKINSSNASLVNNSYYCLYLSNPTKISFSPSIPDYNGSIYNYLNNNSNIDINLNSGSLTLDSDVINIPSVADDGQTDIVIGIDGVYPGATTEEATDVIMDGVLDNTLDTTMTVTDEYVDAVEAVVINEQPISVNTDHHMIGFTNLPDFVNLNLNSIWHYVSDAVEFASDFISWFVNLLTSVPVLSIPLYMSFTLLIVLSFIRRILL